MHQFTRDLKLGVEINPRVEEVGLVANWRALAETDKLPALVFGTSSDRIRTPKGQSYYLTLSKRVHHDLGIPAAPYVGASWSTYEEKFLFPFGVNVAIGPRWSAMVMNDGVHTHLSTTLGWRRLNLTLLAIERKDFGITFGTAF